MAQSFETKVVGVTVRDKNRIVMSKGCFSTTLCARAVRSDKPSEIQRERG